MRAGCVRRQTDRTSLAVRGEVGVALIPAAAASLTCSLLLSRSRRPHHHHASAMSTRAADAKVELAARPWWDPDTGSTVLDALIYSLRGAGKGL